MTRLIHVIDGQVVTYPDTMDAVRREHPNTSFPLNPLPSDLAPFNRFFVKPTIRPESSDPRTERIEESEPVETPDGWFQSWTYRPATAEEIAEYDLAHLPPPRWGEFSMALVQTPEVSSFLAALPLAVSQALSIALSDISRGGSPEMFCQLLEMYRMPEDLTAKARELATAHDLPQSFVETLK